MSTKKNKFKLQAQLGIKIAIENSNTNAPSSPKTTVATTPQSEPFYKITDEDNAHSLPLKEETLKWLFAIIGAVIVYWILGTIIQNVYHPDISGTLKEANETSFTHDSRPEPMEVMLFRVGVLTLTLCTWLFYSILAKAKLIKNLAPKPFFISFVTIVVIALIGIIYADFVANNPFAQGGTEQPQNSRDLVGKSNFAFFFDGMFLGDYLLAYTCMLIPAIAFVFYYGIKKNNWEATKLYPKIISGISYIFLGLVLLTIFRINVFDFPYTFENKYDFNAVYYSVTQAYAGAAMLADSFTNTYGLYPHFLNPIFQVIGLSVWKFTLVMSFLIVLSFVFNFLFLKKMVNNKLIWFLGCCSLLIFPYFDCRLLINFDAAFVFPPIRLLIPSTLTILAALYLQKRSAIIYYLTFILMGFFILWNPEIGMVCYISWLVFNIYNDFYTTEGRIALKKMVMHLLTGVLAIVVTFTTYKLLITVFYGVSPDIGSLFAYIAHLGKGAMGSLPMVLVHPWNITALILTIGFAYASTHFYKKTITPKASIILLLSVIYLGFFVYFQGRSHNWSFANSATFSLILLTILGDELWTNIKDKGNAVLPLHFLFVVFLFLISFSFFELLYNAKPINALVAQEDNKDKQAEEQNRIGKNTDFILSHSHEKEKIYIFTAMPFQGLYFDGYKRKSAFNPGMQDMVLNSNLVALESKILDSSFTAFVEPNLCTYGFLNRPFAALAATYQVKTKNETMYQLCKRTTKIPNKAFLGQNADNIIYRKYTDDTAGIKQRIKDGLGLKPIALNPTYSVEVLFYADTQMFQYATLVGNIDDSSGFIIANIVNTPNYFFGINGKGMALPLPINQWVYCVMNTYPDHLEIYQNGILAGTVPLATPMRQSARDLTIGNMGFMRHYIGAIAEVAIHNNQIDKSQIAAKWEEINNNLAMLGKR